MLSRPKELRLRGRRRPGFRSSSANGFRKSGGGNRKCKKESAAANRRLKGEDGKDGGWVQEEKGFGRSLLHLHRRRGKNRQKRERETGHKKRRIGSRSTPFLPFLCLRSLPLSSPFPPLRIFASYPIFSSFAFLFRILLSLLFFLLLLLFAFSRSLFFLLECFT